MKAHIEINHRLRRILRQWLPFPVRLWVVNMRTTSGCAGLLGCLRAGGLRASVSRHASARLWRQVHIGRDCVIDAGACFHTNDNFNVIRIIVGNGSFIGRNCFFSAGELIHIGPWSNIGASCNLLAAGHEYNDPIVPYSIAPVVSYGHMTLGPNTWIGVGCTLVGGLSIGYGTIVAAGSLLRQSLPPLCLAAGAPAIIVKLYDWPSRQWIRLPNSGPERETALAHHLETIPTEAEYVRLLKY